MKIRKINMSQTFEEFMEEHDLILVVEWEGGLYHYNIEHPNGSYSQMCCTSQHYDMGIRKMSRLISGKQLHFCGKTIIVPVFA